MERERHEIIGYCPHCGEAVREWDKFYKGDDIYACWMCDKTLQEKMLLKKEIKLR